MPEGLASTPEKSPLNAMPVTERPFDRIAMDVTGLLLKSSWGYQYILVLMDYATQFPEVVPLRSVTEPKTATELMKWVARFGIPKKIMTDQGQMLCREFCKAFLKCFILDTNEPWFTILKLMGW